MSPRAYRCFAAAALGAAVAIGAMPAAIAQPSDPAPVRPGTDRAVTQLLVKYRKAVEPVRPSGAVTGQASTDVALEPGRALPVGRWRTVELDEAATLTEAARVASELSADPRVVAVEPDYPVTVSADYSGQQWDLQWPGQATQPFGVQMDWEAAEVDTPVVAVLDTGATEHPDVKWLPGYDFVEASFLSIDGDGRDPDATDPGDGCYPASSTWHGTHVAGTIGARDDNGIGVVGMIPNARLQPVRVLGSCGSGYLSDIIDGIVWAAGGDVHGVPGNATPAAVLNLSLSVVSYEPVPCPDSVQRAVTLASGKGSVVVVAGGNSGIQADVPLANCDGVVAVAATDKSGARASFSNYGPNIDIAAPGYGILSTSNSGTTTAVSPSYRRMSGTSMAAPHVAAAAALYMGQHPGASPAEVEQALKDSATSFPMQSGEYSCQIADGGCGAGIVNVAQLLGGSATGSTPSVVTDVAATPGDGSIEASFTAPTTGATRYQVVVEDGARRTVAVGGLSPVRVSGLTNGTSYRVLVRAGNDAGWGPKTTVAREVVPAGVPSAVRGLRAVVTGNSVELSWGAPTSSASRAEVTGYAVSGPVSGRVGPGQQRWSTTALPAGTHTFQVVPISDSGAGAATRVSVTVVPSTGVKQTQHLQRPIRRIKRGSTTRLPARTSAGLPVAWSTKTPQRCSISGRTLKAVKKGKCVVRVSNTGDDAVLPLSARFRIRVR